MIQEVDRFNCAASQAYAQAAEREVGFTRDGAIFTFKPDMSDIAGAYLAEPDVIAAGVEWANKRIEGSL